MKRTGYERRTADMDGDFVVFLIGMNINRWRAVRAWRPVVQAMPRMLVELNRRPDLGLIKAYGAWMFGGPAAVQYWRSYEDLLAYSRSTDAAHLPAWREFNRAARRTDAVGIWHETYRVARGQSETIYGGMKDVGLLGAVGGRTLTTESTSATRMNAHDHDLTDDVSAAPQPSVDDDQRSR